MRTRSLDILLPGVVLVRSRPRREGTFLRLSQKLAKVSNMSLSVWLGHDDGTSLAFSQAVHQSRMHKLSALEVNVGCLGCTNYELRRPILYMQSTSQKFCARLLSSFRPTSKKFFPDF